MAAFNGINASIYINDTNVLSGMAEFSLDIAMSPVEDTYFTQEWDTHVPSVRGVTGSFSGNVVSSAAKTLIDDAILNGTAIAISIYETQANYWYMATAYITGVSESVDVKGKGTVSYNFQASGQLTYNTRWASSTWTIASNEASSNPSLSAELATNTDFASDTVWTKGTGWTISGGLGNKASGAVSQITQAIASLGILYQVQFEVTSFVGGIFRAVNGTTSNVGLSRTSTGTFIDHLRNLTSSAIGVRATSTSSEGSIDNVSIKSISRPTTIKALNYSDATSSVGVVLKEITAGTLAGVFCNLDSESNPQSLIIAHHDGASTLRFEKAVAGTWTTLATYTVAFAPYSFVEIRNQGSNQFEVFFNGVSQGGAETVSDAQIISNTRYGVFSSYSSNKLLNFYLNNIHIPY